MAFTEAMLCSQCHTRSKEPGGRYKIINKGKNRRWMCVFCWKAHVERQTQRLMQLREQRLAA